MGLISDRRQENCLHNAVKDAKTVVWKPDRCRIPKMPELAAGIVAVACALADTDAVMTNGAGVIQQLLLTSLVLGGTR